MYIVILEDIPTIGDSLFKTGELLSFDQIKERYINDPRYIQSYITVYSLENKKFYMTIVGGQVQLEESEDDMTPNEAKHIRRVLEAPADELVALIANKELREKFPVLFNLVKARVEGKL